MRSAPLLIVLILLASNIFAQELQQKLPSKTRILFLLDGSGSMLGKWEDGLRIDVAKQYLGELVDSLSVNDNLELGLRVYGHQYHSSVQNCEDTRLEVPFGKGNHGKILEALTDVKPKGTTPIAYALKQTAKDFPPGRDVRNIVIILTDGIESCDGEVCDVSLALQRRGIFLRPFVIGLGMTKEYQEQFGCVGQYFDASEVSNFRSALATAIRSSLGRTTVSVELTDRQGNRNEKDVNVTFYNNFTREPAYEFVHYRDRKGRPDSVEVDGVLSYDLVVNTVPPVIKRGVELDGGRHNVIAIPAPQGTLALRQPSHTDYEKGVKVMVRPAGSERVLFVQDMGTDKKYLEGTYDLEFLTLPSIHKKGVNIKQGSESTLTIDGPGILDAYASVAGSGSIYTLPEKGRQQWVANLDTNKRRHSLALQPGTYKVVFRAENAMGSKYTLIHTVTIRTGAVTTINLIDP
ncbi:VWA domain-containing protein [Roseivirga sp. BDSF3-8]|uniref:vWA domain-containing protein n=1 Tax=Roseivirga sp. BDSF3-8 TaxID=3241598 RepID=UPI0035317F10